jgi:hypothetical protein
MEKDYVLYGTSACHLCEMAEAILGPIIKRYSITFTKEDILEDDALLQQYALSIPVFKCITTKAELNWPFNEEMLNTFINSQ